MLFLTLASAFTFAICLGLLAHTYAIFPLLMDRLTRGRQLSPVPEQEDHELPELAVLMAVYNEESVLKRTLDSLASVDYPADRFHVWIGSDGSTDRSREIIESYRGRILGLEFREFGGRNGKIRIINSLAEEARASFANPDSALFGMCDANVAWAEDLPKTLARHFQRNEVGLVGTNVLDETQNHSGIGHEEEAYVGRENRTKWAEGVLWGRTMGAFGACYAMRAQLFEAVPDHFIVDDFYSTMSVLEQGHDAIVDLEAQSYEAVSSDIREEFRRKKRIATGNFQNLFHFRKLLWPLLGSRETVFAFWSHKGLRWFGPILIIGMLLSTLALSILTTWGWLLAAGILGSFAIAAVDAWFEKLKWAPHLKLFRFVRYFYSMNLALLLGFFAFLRGGQNSVWEPTERVAHHRPGDDESENLAPLSGERRPIESA
ncbi:MAG: glycosyltransferase [Verrucomicrobiota bacterium]